MKKIILIFLVVLLIAAGFVAWLFLGPDTAFDEKTKYLYIRTNAATRTAVLDSLKKNDIIKSVNAFEWLADQRDYWKNIKPGRYEIKKGSSVMDVLRKLRNGQQAEVKLTITTIKTKEDLARYIGARFESDSLAVISFLNNPDTLSKYGLDTNTVMTAILPDTYTYFWNSTPQKIFQKLYDEYKRYWTEERKQQAANRGLDPAKAHILASIVEEETSLRSDKGKIASVYINRIEKNMPLQADPTLKFAARKFELQRIYDKHKLTESPYNTYKYAGLPPGPICIPSKETISEVINSPKTDYLFFVASYKLDKTSIFTTSYDEHRKYAKMYTDELDKRNVK